MKRKTLIKVDNWWLWRIETDDLVQYEFAGFVRPETPARGEWINI